MSTPEGPRSVKIGSDERGGWSSDRPRREGGPPRPADVSVRTRVLTPGDRMRYDPGSLLMVVSPSRAERDRFVQRVIEDRSAVLSLDKVRALLAGRVPDEDVEARAAELLDAATLKRLQASETVVLAAEGVSQEERDRFVRLAAGVPRPRHLILLEARRDEVAEEDRPVVNDLRRALDAGELGSEGFHTSLRLGGATIDEVKRILFRPPPRDE
ncbi:MAG: hypothetical protein QOD44_2725 [Solirubrobacteraceae bacterium]|jgi:hypothetical protein|nr:hypothetical protein [Solirubrobacteraceae bacterium]MEA2318536.1 hypothetical protein [Solirubrobacteraceae bacterium]